MLVATNKIVELMRVAYNTDYSYDTSTGRQLLDELKSMPQKVLDELKNTSYPDEYSFIFSLTLEKAMRLYMFTNDPPSKSFNQFLVDLVELQDILELKYKNQGYGTWTDDTWYKGLNFMIKHFIDAVMSKKKTFILTECGCNTPISADTYHDVNLSKIIVFCYMYLSKDQNTIPVSLREWTDM